MNLKPIQNRILTYLRRTRSWCTPTLIGTVVGLKSYDRASSWTCAQLKPLVKAGLVEKEKGAYRAVEEKP